MGTLNKDPAQIRSIVRHIQMKLNAYDPFWEKDWGTKSKDKQGDPPREEAPILNPTKGYGYKSRRGKKRNNRCSSRRK